MYSFKRLFLFAAVFIVAGILSCSRSDEGIVVLDGAITVDDDFSDVIVPEERFGLYADLSDYDLVGHVPATRASDVTKTLESMLDRGRRTEKTVNGKTFLEIPFVDEECYASYGDGRDIDGSDATVVRKFLVTVKKKSGINTFVATLVCSKQYERMNPDFTYTDKRNFTGISLISKIDGTLCSMRRYTSGRIDIVEPVSANSSEVDCQYIQFLSYFGKIPETRGNYGGTIAASRCIAYRYNWLNPSFCYGFIGNGGSGNGYGTTGNYWNDLNYKYVEYSLDVLGITGDEICFTVMVTTNTDDVIMMGSGIYGTNDNVDIYPVYTEPENYVQTYEEPRFDHWVGDFGNIRYEAFCFSIQEDVRSVAYYNNGNLPCADNKNLRTNPLRDMNIAPAGWTIVSGTFGPTRIYADGTPKWHYGIDLYAEPGTPVYAAYEGDIVYMYDNAPNKNVDTSCGNEIDIMSTITNPATGKEETIYCQYAHLQYGNAIAYNYREGRPFQNHDHVYRGELIGYTGRTGNAFNVQNPHLHFAVGKKLKGSWVDPIDYLNGTYDGNFKSTRISSTRCDTGPDVEVNPDEGDKPGDKPSEDIMECDEKDAEEE